MGMMLKVLTLPFVPALGGFDPAPIEALVRQAEILEATPAFFERGGTQYWSVVVACRLHAGGPGAPAVAASREGVRGVETARAASGSAAPGAYAPPQIPDQDRGAFQALRQWRGGEADRQGVPAYMIHDPKEREISVAPFRDRVVHQALCGVVAPILERSAIHHSYACRVGKGTHRAIRQAQRLVRGRAFFLKCDVRRFFASVDHDVLKALLRRCLKDDRVLDLCDRIIDADGADALGGRRAGLPIGNLTSQHLANFYLSGLDHFVLEELRPAGYLRYMDDFLLCDDDRGRLAGMLREVRGWLADQRALRLKEQVTLLTRTGAGLPFLALRIYPGVLRLRRRKARRFVRLLRRRVREHSEGRLTDAALQGSLGSILAHVQPGSGPAFRREVLRSVHFPE